MKPYRLVLVRYCVIAAVLGFFCGTTALAGSADVALLVQATPEQGGEVSPGMGVMKYSLDQEVTLTATPKPGFDFAYWLGDVSDPTSAVTTAYINKPKIIVAVFEKNEHRIVTPGIGGGGRSVTEAATASSSFSYSPSFSGTSGSTSSGSTVGTTTVVVTGGGTTDNPGDPGEGGDPGEPGDPTVPEPATVALLLFGSLVAFRRKNR